MIVISSEFSSEQVVQCVGKLSIAHMRTANNIDNFLYNTGLSPLRIIFIIN